MKNVGIKVMLILCAMQAQAQTAGVFVDIGTCMQMQDDEQRYACYDQLENQVRAAQSREDKLPIIARPSSTTTEVISASEEMPQEKSAAAEFGWETPQSVANKANQAKVLGIGDGEQALLDTVATLKQPMPDQWQVTLASGQIWRQVNSKPYQLREGMEVRVYPSPFGGSFRLSADKVNGFIQVRRLQ